MATVKLMKSIHEAARLKTGELHKIASQVSDIDVLSPEGFTALHIATMEGNVGNVKYLIKKRGANVNINPSIRHAIITDNHALFAALLKGKPSFGTTTIFLGNEVTVHDLVVIAPSYIFFESAKYLVSSDQMTDSIAGRYLMKFIMMRDYDAVTSLVRLGIYRTELDPGDITTAIFVTYTQLTAHNTLNFVHMIMRSGLVSSLEIILACHPHPHVAKYFLQCFREAFASPNGEEMMKLVVCAEENILESRGILAYGTSRVPWAYELERARSKSTRNLNGIERLIRVKCISSCHVRDLPDERRRLLYNPPPDRYKQALQFPTLRDISFIQLDLIDRRNRLNLLKQRIDLARSRGQWQLIFQK